MIHVAPPSLRQPSLRQEWLHRNLFDITPWTITYNSAGLLSVYTQFPTRFNIVVLVLNVVLLSEERGNNDLEQLCILRHFKTLCEFSPGTPVSSHSKNIRVSMGDPKPASCVWSVSDWFPLELLHCSFLWRWGSTLVLPMAPFREMSHQYKSALEAALLLI